MRITSIGRIGWMRTAVAVAAATLMLLPATTATVAASASPRVTVAVPKVASKQSADISVFANNNGVLTPNQELAVTAVITNTGSDALSPGSLQLGITNAAFADRSGLSAWLSKTGNAPATRQIGNTPTSEITPGTSVTVSLLVPAAHVGITDATTRVFGLSADLVSGGTALSHGTGSLVWNTGGGFSPAGVAIAVPITAPVTADGLISSADLATYTAENGILTRELNGVSGHPDVAIAIDPMIIASIRVLGTTAPASATAWLRQLSLLPNTSFPLQYGDAGRLSADSVRSRRAASADLVHVCHGSERPEDAVDRRGDPDSDTDGHSVEHPDTDVDIRARASHDATAAVVDIYAQRHILAAG